MNREQNLKYLSLALYIIGVIFIFGIYLMMLVWPSGWAWTPRQAEYEQMIMGVYATLGVFLILAARNPLAHASLIWFVVWSSIVHAVIMLIHGIIDETERGHLIGDVPALFIVAAILAYLMPRSGRSLNREEEGLKQPGIG